MPVTVTNFVNIGAISLTLDYNSSALTYVNITPNPILLGNISVAHPAGRLVISWYGTGITLPDLTHLFDITFTYVSGTSLLTWYDNGGSCQYSNGLSIVLNDSPTSDYYINGIITNQAAPVTIAPTVTTAVSGSPVSVNITVNSFTYIGAISLTLEYNPNVLLFQTISPNSALSAWVLNTNTTLVNGKMRLIISCIPPESGGPVTLGYGSTLFTITYLYTASLAGGNYSELKWIDEGGSCQYANGSSAVLYDSPTADYYKNGLVTRQLSPITYLPVITNAIPGGDIWVRVQVKNYTNIKALALEFEYDPAVITFADDFNPNPVFSGDLGVTDWPSTSGKRKTIIGYYGGATTIPAEGSTDRGTIVFIKYHYTSGTTALTWLDDIPSSCGYGDINGYTLYNTPTSEYYFDGVVSFRTTPVTIAESTMGTIGTEIIVPVKVYGFADIGSISLTLDYDPGVLTYLSAVPNCAFITNGGISVTNPGRIMLTWFGPGVTLPDNSTLVELHFTYHGGLSPLNWYDNGGSCQYSDGTSHVLYDLPQSTYYINGLAGSGSWSGNTSTDWNTTTNWVSNIVPTSTITAVIPATPTGARWPTLTGDLTLGGNCKNVIMEGSSELTVTGDLTINPGYALIVTGAGTVKVGENWSNSGAFIPGSGTVDFTGTLPSTILAGVASINNINNIHRSTFAQGMTDLVGGTVTPTGDNTHSDVNIGFSFNYLGTVYTQVRINTNGWISLNKSGDDPSSDNTALFSAVAPNTTLAPWWDALKGGSVSYKSDGSAPNRIFTVEWKGVLSYASDATAQLNFQVKLFETTNVIEFHYGSVASGMHSGSEGASIGLDDASGNYIEATSGTSFWCASNLTSQSSWPTVNYRFTPPPVKETFYRLVGSKTSNTVTIAKDIIVTKP